MPSLDPNAVLANASCFACQGASTAEMLELGLLDRWANAALNSFIERAGLTDPTQIASVTDLYEAAIEHGWWAKCDLIYPFVGGNANAHAQNLKSNQFTITWNGTVTHNANGITGDGATGYGDTGYASMTSGQISQNSIHLGIYRRTAGANARGYIGSEDNGGLGIKIIKGAIVNQVFCNICTVNATGSISAVFRWSVGSRVDAANQHYFHDNADTVGAFASSPVTPFNIFILSRNNAGVPAAFSNANLAGATAGAGLTFAEYQLMAADWQTFQTSLGRQV